MLVQLNTTTEKIIALFDLKKNQNLTKEQQFSKIREIIKYDCSFLQKLEKWIL